MSRLIDADALKKAFNAEGIFYEHIDAIINDAPTVDTVPNRECDHAGDCKDCDIKQSECISYLRYLVHKYEKLALENAIKYDNLLNTVPVVHGKWLRGAMKEPTRLLCTNCDWDGPDYVKRYSYCPNCGAKMEGGE